jgi:hypothetical protein
MGLMGGPASRFVEAAAFGPNIGGRAIERHPIVRLKALRFAKMIT